MRLRKAYALAVTVLLVATLSACATMPIGRHDLLDFLQDGKTSREEVFLHLAEPSGIFEGGRILTYRLGEDKGGYTIKGAKGAPAQWSAKYSLVLSFDETGVLRKHAVIRVQEVFTP
jgi:hypothetical protein